MSILIKGMEMPKNCHECPLLYVTSICDGFKDCPLVELPPHGRLIDESDILEYMDKNVKIDSFQGYLFRNTVGIILDNAPTIIEAEGVE